MKKILIASDTATHPCTSGNRQCIMQQAEVLRSIGFEVFFLLIGSQESNAESIAATEKYWGKNFFHYPLPAWQLFVMRLSKRITRQAYPDNIDFYPPAGIVGFANTLHAEYNFKGIIVNYIWQSKLAGCKIPVRAIFTHDVFTDREKRYKDGREWHHHSLREERRALRRFPYILAIQDEERRYFSTLAPDSEVRTVYTSFPFVEQPVAEGKNILFFSGRNNFNINGIRRFIRTTLPLLAERDASIRLLIGGDICSVLDKEELPGNITLAGKYDSPADFYRLGNIAINPVYEGTGLKIKTFEAIARGKTTIADPHSAKGIYRPELAPLITATTPEEYADSILRYIDSPDAIEKNRERCRSYIESLNSYIQAQYRDIFDK